jgi:enterochelin esterase-like enzyme
MHPLRQRAQNEGTPLVDGENVTFVWAGEQPPLLLADFNHFDPRKAAPLSEAAPGVWHYTIKIPRDALVEYAYVTDLARADSDEGRAVDPFNPRRKWNGMSATNHYFYMPEAGPTPLVQRQRGVARGQLSRHRVDTDGLAATRRRELVLYRPAVDGPVPLLVVYDGIDYLKQAEIPTLVDNLIAQKRIQPPAMALVQNGRYARTLEYGCSDMTIGFLLRRVLPLAQAELNLIDVERSPGSYAILGASMGGVMALYSGWRRPQIFGKVLSQSGAFGFDDHEFVIYDLVDHGRMPPLQIWMDVGIFDFLLSTNRRMHELLRHRQAQVTYNEYSGGHNYYAWRDDLAAGLEKLFPPVEA